MRSRVVLGLLITVLLLAAEAGCASGSEADRPPSTTAASTSTAEPVRAAAPKPGRRVDASMRTADGRVRTYRVYIPSTLPAGKAVPLLVALHGGLGNGKQFEANSGYDAVADAGRFLVVYPDGTPIPARPAGRVWNAGSCCAAAADDRDDVDDVAFISSLIDRLARTYRIDRGRVFATGHSNGAMLSYRLACELSSKIVGIGAQSGALLQSTCRPSKPVSVLAIHGTADQNVPIRGGVGPRGVSGVDFPPPPDGPATFAKIDRCAGSTTTTSRTNPDVTTRAWTGCRSGTRVRWVTVKGANHAWMGHPSASPASAALVGTPYPDLDSSATIWRFLAALPARR